MRGKIAKEEGDASIVKGIYLAMNWLFGCDHIQELCVELRGLPT